MSRRERPAPRLAQPASKPGRSPAAPESPAGSASAGAGEQFDWGRLFQGISPAQREKLVALARSQGLLYLFQLPPAANDAHTDISAELLVHALAGQITRLAPTYPEPVAINDGELDSVERCDDN